jgi:hypothetical protein
MPLPFLKNRAGEWANYIHIFPKVLGHLDREQDSLLEFQDSNLFMTAGIAYPLYLFDETQVDDSSDKPITKMRQRALASFSEYQHGDAFTFWPKLPGATSSAPRVGPLNIPYQIGEFQQLMKFIPIRSGSPHFKQWLLDVHDKTFNPYGVDALANIPSDADDTALALSIQNLAAGIDQQTVQNPAAAFDQLMKFRDQSRTMEDNRDSWKGRDSGAFLTWLKDENLSRDERFKSPETGVIPLSVNNVDCIVNANVLLSFGLAGRADEPAVIDASVAMRRAVELKAWPKCGLYYPQKMMFPYVLTRAYRDGRVNNAEMQLAIDTLLIDLLAEQQETARLKPQHKGAFSGGADISYDLATALGASALLKIGPETADRLGLGSAYRAAIEDAIGYLLKTAKSSRIRFAETFNTESNYTHYPLPWDTGTTWQAGVFFSASNWNLAQWRSQPYSTALALEALTKYVLGYDLYPDNFLEGRRLSVKRYARNTAKAADDFKFEVSAP